MNPLLDVQGVSKSFRGLRAVADFSMRVDDGAIIALIGPNGAGKTTIFDMISGAAQPDSGRIMFAGTRVEGLRADQICHLGVARTFQLVKPFTGLSVLDNVIVGALTHTSRLQRARERAERILEQLGLSGKKDLSAAALTLPDRKRLEVARAIATQPKLLLLDEVMAGLRPAECAPMIEFLREINRRTGVTILLIEHVMRAVMALAQKIVVLHHGEVIAAGVPEEIVRDPAVLACYLGDDVKL